MRKVLIYLKQIVLLTVGNKLRCILLFVGISVGIFIFSLGNFLLDSYYYGKSKEIREMPEQSLYISMQEYNQKIINKFFFLNQKRPIIERSSNISYVIYESTTSTEQEFIVQANVYGMSSMGKSAVIYESEYGENMISTEVVSGRLLTASEIKNNEKVCVIDEYTSQLLFGQNASVGKYIYFNLYNGGAVAEGVEESEPVAYKIVGVIKNSYYTNKQRIQTKKNVGTDSPSVYAFVSMFCPYDYYKYLNEESMDVKNVSLLWEGETREEQEKLFNQIKPKVGAVQKDYNISDVIDKKVEMQKLTEELAPLKRGINIGTLALLIISGVSCMSILFFSMKERATEIGIKKAFGASWLDILFQFLLENTIISLCSVVFAVLVSVVIAYATEGYIQSHIFDDYELHLTFKNILMPIMAGMIQAIIFTGIPSIRYSFMRATKALRIE